MSYRHSIMIALATALLASYSAQAQEEQEAPLKTEAEKLSYAMGMDFGSMLRMQDIEIDPAVFADGLNDAFTGEDTVLTDEEAQEVLQAFQQKLRDKQMAEMQAAQEENQRAGEAFLEENAQKEGVKETESGLQYEVVEEGDGSSPAPTDEVTVHYVGTTIDGETFDSSRERGQPATFQLNKVIPGWTEGLQLMKEGAHYKFYIPSDLAYGSRGAPPAIEPNSTLIFDVELLEVK